MKKNLPANTTKNTSKEKELLNQLKNSEEFNKSLLESNLNCVKVLDLQGNLLSMNTPGLKIMEIDDFNQFKGKCWLDFWKDKDNKEAWKAVDLAKKGKTGHFVGYTFTAKGNFKWWDVRVMPIYDDMGKIYKLLSISTDISEERKIEEERKLLVEQIQTEKSKLVDIIKNAPAFIAILKGKDHTFEMANDPYMQLIGHRDIIGKTVANALPEVIAQGYITLLDDVYNTKKPFIGNEIKVFLQRSKKAILEERYINFVYQPIHEVEGLVSGIFVHGVDVTEQVLSRKKVEESEERYKTLFTSVDEGFCIIEMIFDKKNNPTDYRFLEINPVFETQTGILNAIGKTIRELVPNIEDSWFKIYGKVALTGESVRFENESDALERIFSVYATRVGGEHSRKVAILFTNITEKKRSQKLLQESETRLQFMADSMPQQVWTATPAGALDYVNLYTCNYFKKSSEEIIGDGWQNVIHPEDLPECIKLWTNSLQTGEPYQVFFRLLRSDNSYRWHLGRALAQKNGEKIIKWFGTNTDIDDQKKLEKQKDDFLAIASHELKTPVTSIKAYAQILEKSFRKQGDLKTAGHLNKMDIQINKLSNLIGDLLDVTKIQAGKLQFNRVLFDFNELIDETIEDLQRTSTKHTIVKELKGKKIIYSDKERIEQVVINFITNAIKYSPQAVKIIVKTSIKENEVSLCVKDFGLGISQENQKKVFEQFYRVDGDQQNTFPGLGLGLYISSEIIKQEDGKIWVESEEGKGSTFCFSLPIKKSNLK